MDDQVPSFLVTQEFQAVYDDFFKPTSHKEEPDSDDESKVEVLDSFAVDPEDDEKAVSRLEFKVKQDLLSVISSCVREEEISRLDVDHYSKCPCDCKRGIGQARCITMFTNEQISDARLSTLELDRAEKDIALLSIIQAGSHRSQKTQCRRRSTQNVRQKNRTDYFFLGRQICSASLAYLYAVGSQTLKVLVGHFAQVKGISPRQKKKAARSDLVTYEQCTMFSQFMKTSFKRMHWCCLGR